MEMIVRVSNYKVVALQVLVFVAFIHISFINTAGIVSNVSISLEDFKAIVSRIASLESRQSSTETDIQSLENYSGSFGQLIANHKEVEITLDKVLEEIWDTKTEHDNVILEVRKEMEQIKQDYGNLVIELRNELKEMKRYHDSVVVELREELKEMEKDCDRFVIELQNQTQEMNRNRGSSVIALQDRMRLIERDLLKMQELQNASSLRQEEHTISKIQELAKVVNEIMTNVSDISETFPIGNTETKGNVESLKNSTLNMYNSNEINNGSLFNGTGYTTRNSTNISKTLPANLPTISPTTKGLNIPIVGSTGREYLITTGCADKGLKLFFIASAAGNVALCQGSTKCKEFIMNKGINVYQMSPPVPDPSRLDISETSTISVSSSVYIGVLVQENMKSLSEIQTYLALPLTMLSTQYVTATYRTYHGFSNYSYLYCYVQVAALYDATRINVILNMRNGSKNVFSFRNQMYNNGDVFEIVLNKHQTFKLETQTDFTGTYVQSSKPVAVFSGCCGTDVSSNQTGHDYDFIMQMIPPVKCLKNNFIIPPFMSRLGFIIRVISAETNTRIMLNQQSHDLSNIGSVFEYDASTPNTSVPVTVSSDKPVLTVLFAKTGYGERNMQISYMGGGANMIIVPAISQYISSYSFVVPEAEKIFDYVNDSYVTVISPQSTTPSLLLDDSPLLAKLANTINEKHTVTFQSVTYDVISFKIDPGLYIMSSYTAEKFGMIHYGFKYANGWGNPVYLSC